MCVEGGDRQTEMHTAESFVPEPSASEVDAAVGKYKDTNCQMLIRFQQNWFKQEWKHCILRCMNLLSLSVTKKNFLTSEKVNCHTYSQKG
jgi:hypothetical protein